MKVRALISFCGKVNMAMGEVAELDPALASDLAKVNYVEILDEPTAKAEKPVERKEEKQNGKKSKVSSPRNGTKHGKR